MSNELKNVKVEEIKETNTYPKKDGKGTVDVTKLKIGNMYFTSFKKEEIEALKVGDMVDVFYTSKDNVYEGRTYTNHNISGILPAGEQKTIEDLKAQEVPEGKEIKPEEIKVETIKINPSIRGEAIVELGNKKFKVILEEQ